MIVTSATAADVYDLLASRGIERPRHDELKSMLFGIAAGPAWALRVNHAIPPAALLGMIPGDALEFWSHMGAGAELVLPAIVATGRSLMRNVMVITGLPAEMYIASSNRAGHVMAAACGLVKTGDCVMPGIDIWRTG